MVQADASGTEFWIAIPPNEIAPFPVEGLEIFVSSAFAANVEFFDYSSDRSLRFKLNPYETKTLSDQRELNWSMEVRDAETPIRKALRLKSDQPINVNVINSKTTTSDGYLAIPAHRWGTEYIAASYWDFREAKPWPGGFLIIAKEPTNIKILLRGKGQFEAKTSGGRSIGDSISMFLDEGELYMVHGDGQTRGVFDLTGSLITSDKPIGVIGFHMRTTMPNLLINGNGRNHLSEMLPPTNRWGRRYSTLEFNRTRNLAGRGDVFRVVAKDSNTRWSCKYYDKNTGNLLGVRGGIIAEPGGFAEEKQATQPTALIEGFSVWEADKPIMLMQYSCSSSWDGDQILDPFMICVTPREQFVWDAIFQVPTMGQFTTHNVNLIVQVDTTDKASIEQNLKSLEIDDIPVWKHPQATKLLDSKMPNGDYHVTIKFETESRSHRISSNGLVRFGGYLYGYGAVDAYGWPISSAFRATSPRDTIGPIIAGSPSCGDYSLEVTELRNNPNPPLKVPADAHQVESGIAGIDSIRGKGNFNYRLVRITDQRFPENQAYKKFSYSWQVIDKSKNAQMVYYVVDHAGNMTLDTCVHNAARLASSEKKLDFGKLRLGSNATRSVSITNTSTYPIILSDARLKTGSQFAIVSGKIDPAQQVVLAPGASHTLGIRYDGSRETADLRSDFDRDTVIIASPCGEQKIGVSGVAAIARISVQDWDAGTREIGESHCAPLVVSNPGSDTLIIRGIRGFENTAFRLSTNVQPAIPIIIRPNDSVRISNVCFRSDVSADSKAEVTFSSNGAGPDSVSTWTGSTLTSSIDDASAELISCDGIRLHVQDRHAVVAIAEASPQGQITIHDLRGQIVATIHAQHLGQTPITIGPLAPGSYVASLGMSSKPCSLRFIITR